MKPVPIPESHQDLLDGDYCAALTTVMPDGQPQITPVWCNRDREAEAHADKLTQLYTGKQRFYGDIYLSNKSRRKRASSSKSSRSEYRWMRFSNR